MHVHAIHMRIMYINMQYIHMQYICASCTYTFAFMYLQYTFASCTHNTHAGASTHTLCNQVYYLYCVCVSVCVRAAVCDTLIAGLRMRGKERARERGMRAVVCAEIQSNLIYSNQSKCVLSCVRRWGQVMTLANL